MTIHPPAGKPAPKEILVDVDKLRKEYYARKPDITDSAERVAGHLRRIQEEAQALVSTALAGVMG